MPRGIDYQDPAQTEPPGTPYTPTSPSSPSGPGVNNPTTPTTPTTAPPTTNPTDPNAPAAGSEPSLIDQILALGGASGGSIPNDQSTVGPAPGGVNWLLILILAGVGIGGFFLYRKYGKESHA